MAKIQIKSKELTPFGGIFPIMEQFDSTLSSVIDSALGLRCRSFGYQYSEIVRWISSFVFSPWQSSSKLNSAAAPFVHLQKVTHLCTSKAPRIS